MSAVTRRAVLGAGAGLALTAFSGCAPESLGRTSVHGSAPPTRTGAVQSPARRSAPGGANVQLLGDGSTSRTGPQPHQPALTRLLPGQRPPQFVVFSWDGAGETGAHLFSQFRDLAKRLSGSMTFFLSGLYTVPADKRMLYRPPQHPRGASAIGFLPRQWVHATIEQVGRAWLDGHEIGTHFNGHFCGSTGVSRWSPQDWNSEIGQAKGFVKSWRSNTGFTDLPPLPFDYDQELIGSRTPCLEGQANLMRSEAARRWRYDSSGTGTQVWPARLSNGLWNVPMQAIPFPGHSFEVISMDYNMMYNQSRTPNGDPGMRATWRTQAENAYLAGFRRAYHSNRAPLIIGNHFERWNGGIYMEAVDNAMTQIAAYPEVRLVSFHQLIDWLENQDPAVLSKLRTLQVGESPPHGWGDFA